MSKRIAGAFTALVAAGVTMTSLSAPSLAAAEADNDDLCWTTRSTNYSSIYYNKPGEPRESTSSSVYDWINYTSAQTTQRFSKSVKLPDNLIKYDYVPQGLTAIPNWLGGTNTEDLLLISSYHDADHNREPDGDSVIWGVTVNGSRPGTYVGRVRIAQGHVGGIAVVGNFVYVGTEKTIRMYKKSRIVSLIKAATQNQAPEPTAVTPHTVSYDVGFMGSGNGKLWAGDFDENVSRHLNQYAVNATTGGVTYETQFYAPKKTQGVAVTTDRAIFGTSWTRNDRSNIWIMPRQSDSAFSDGTSTCFRAPSMIEGLTILEGRLYALYESGANTYTQTGDRPVNIIQNIHSAKLTDVTGLYQVLPD